MKEPKMMNIKNYIPQETTLIQPLKESPRGLFVPGIIFKYGKPSRFLKVIIFVFPHIIKTIHNVKKSYSNLKKNPSLKKTIIEPPLLKDFEAYAKKIGCPHIAYTKVPREYIFSNKAILYDNAIVLSLEMKKEKIKKAPSISTSKEIWRAYAKLGKNVNKLAAYLRKKGFQTQAGPALGGETNYPRLAQKAGLGYIGKHGLLISEECGPSQRIAAIYTNIENLPFTDSDRYNWIPEFCEHCNQCVKKCPAQAIYKETIINKDGSQQHIDYTKCAIPFSQSMGCSVCIKECVFFKSDFNKIKEGFFKKKTRDKKVDQSI